MPDVFDAVSDPTRRKILELLKGGDSLSLNEVCEPLPMSRQAVSKHLQILESAGLIEARWSGRQKLHRLKAEPLRELNDWLAAYAAAWDRRLARLELHLKEAKDE